MINRLASLCLLAASVGATAAVIAPDRRAPMSLVAPRAPFLMTNAEASRIRNTVGYVFCPGAVDQDNRAGSTAVLVGTATDQYVLTALHTFTDERGAPRHPLSSCTFTAFGLRAEPIPLLFTRRSSPSYWFATTDWVAQPGSDVALVRLSRPSPEAQPFRLSEVSASLEGLGSDALFAVSAVQAGFNANQDLIMQNCATRRFFAAKPWRGSAAYTDCSARVGASGSALFTRVNGALTLIGLVVQSKDGEDGLPYDEATKNFSLAIGLDGPLIEKIAKFLGDSF